MGPGNGEINDLATRVAICKNLMEDEMGNDGYVDTLLNAKDNVDKEKVMECMDEFSCKEELNRYVENLEKENNS